LKIIILNTLLLLSSFVYAQHYKQEKVDKFSKIKISSKQVSKNTYLLTGAGGNIAVNAGSDGIILVDSQFSPLSKRIKSQIRKIKKGPIKFLINTHYHGDHTGGNAIFGKKSIIVAHENVRKRLSKDQFSSFFKKTTKKQVRSGMPVVTFTENMKLHYNDEEIEMIHFANGHTDGDAIILFHGSKVAHLGDHFFSGKFPYVDLDGGGNVVQYHKNVVEILKRVPKDYQIIPGHGPLSTYKDLVLFEEMISDSIERVKDEKSIGTTPTKINLTNIIIKYKNFEKGFINEKAWIKLIVDSL
jgi:cyclase